MQTEWQLKEQAYFEQAAATLLEREKKNHAVMSSNKEQHTMKIQEMQLGCSLL